jgi:hypothetical protein
VEVVAGDVALRELGVEDGVAVEAALGERRADLGQLPVVVDIALSNGQPALDVDLLGGGRVGEE